MKSVSAFEFEKQKSELLDWITSEKRMKSNPQSFIDDLNKFESLVKNVTISDMQLLRKCWFRSISESIKLLESTTFLGLWKKWVLENVDSIKATL